MVERLLEFRHIFPNEEAQPLSQYLQGCSKSIIQNITACFLSIKDTSYQQNALLLSKIFCPKNADYAQSILNRIHQLQQIHKAPFNIINIYSSLRLFDLHEELGDEQTQTEVDFERNFFKVYLLLNEEWSKKQDNAIDSVELFYKYSDDDINKKTISLLNVLTFEYPTFDKQNIDKMEVFFSQLYKSVHFFKFIESQADWKDVYTAFLTKYECENWQEYIKGLWPIIFALVENENNNEPLIVEIPEGDHFEKNCNFLDNLLLEKYESDCDFRPLREKPMIKYDAKSYKVVFDLFTYNKMYDGLYFIFLNLIKNKNWKDKFRSFITYEFSEKTLSYRILEKIFLNNTVKLTGSQISDEYKFEGGPDYYVRNRNKIFIFEAKDVFIASDKKMSFDYSIYDSQFEDKFYFTEKNGVQKEKAIAQLIKNAKNILSKEITFDNNFNDNTVSIYPILLTFRSEYDIPGLNILLNKWFQEELNELEEKGYRVKNVRPLLIINIDSLIYRLSYLTDGIDIEKVIDSFFINNINFKSYDDVSKLSFTYYLDKYVKKYIKKTGKQLESGLLEELTSDIFKLATT